MLRATIKSLLARKLRLVLTALAVVLGVGMTAGSFILTDTALKSFDDLFGDVFKGTDVVVQAQTAFDPERGRATRGGGSERKPIPESVLPEVQAVDGVAAADGAIGGTAWIVDPATNKVIQNGGAPPIGGSWDPGITTLADRSRWCAAAGSRPGGDRCRDRRRSRDRRSANASRWSPRPARPSTRSSGIARFGSSNSLLGATLALFDLPTAQKLFDRAGEFDAIYVKADAGRQRRSARPARRRGAAERVRGDHRAPRPQCSSRTR